MTWRFAAKQASGVRSNTSWRAGNIDVSIASTSSERLIAVSFHGKAKPWERHPTHPNKLQVVKICALGCNLRSAASAIKWLQSPITHRAPLRFLPNHLKQNAALSLSHGFYALATIKRPPGPSCAEKLFAIAHFSNNLMNSRHY
jgi:hypothetical protein